jgi:hypothetical protein
MRRDRPKGNPRTALFGWAVLFCLASCTGQVSTTAKDGGGNGETGGPPGDGAGPLPDGASATAQLEWKSSQPHLSKVHALAADGNVLYVSADTGMYLYVLATKLQTRCSAPSGGAATPILAPAAIDANGNAFFSRASQQCLSSIDSGCNPRWDIKGVYFFDCKAASDTRPGLLPGSTEVVVGTSSDPSGAAHVWGVKAADGSEAWHHELKGHSITRSLTVSQDGTVYVGTIQNGIGVLYTLQGGGTPQELFKAAEFHAPGVVVSNGNFVIGDWNKNLHAVSSGGGAVWKGNAGGRIISAPVETGGVVLVAASLYGIYTHDLGGTASWNFKNTKVHYSGVAVDSAGNAYVGSAGDCTGGSAGGCIYAVRDGKLLWAHNTERPVEATPLVHDDLVVAGDEGGTLYGLKTAQ